MVMMGLNIYWFFGSFAFLNGLIAMRIDLPKVIVTDSAISLSLSECKGVKFESVSFYIEMEKNCFGEFVQALKSSSENSAWTANHNLTTKLKENVRFRITTLVELNAEDGAKKGERILTRVSNYVIGNEGKLQQNAKKPIETSYKNEVVEKCKRENAVRANCKPIETELANGKRPKHINELIFDATFHNGYELAKYWLHESRTVHHLKTREIVAFGRGKKNTYIKNNKLHLRATKNRRTKYSAENCTSRQVTDRKLKLECGPIISVIWSPVAPVIGSKIYTEFSFKYGRIEFRAKMADGVWLYPYILLQPNNTFTESQYASQIRLGYAHGNEHLNTESNKSLNRRVLFGSVLNWKDEKPIENYNSYISERSFAANFHNFTVIWHPDRIIYKVDGYTYGIINDKEALKEFQKHCFIVLGITAYGIANFPDDIVKGHKMFSNTHPKAAMIFAENVENFDWVNPELSLEYIRVYATHNDEY